MLHPVYQQSLPPTTSSPAIVGSWARSVAEAEQPTLAERIHKTAQTLVHHVIRDISPHRRLHAELELTDTGLRLTVRVPGHAAHVGSLECFEMSGELTSFGCSGSPAGREAWAELRIETAAVA
ncbi:hypothetical protein OHA25_08400 [Nonomuraea sp. NBC_00507]|uniref:hypothetical protein n=1 Tax=Nonomuraea sp. NBC_00507 TaxID=2976002 RepID=UPI002E19719C